MMSKHKDPKTVMDAGCGTGRLTALPLERLPHGRVVGVDLSQNMLEEARSHLSPRSGGCASFVRSDLAALPFDRAFDGVLSTAAFHRVPVRRAVPCIAGEALRGSFSTAKGM